MILPNILTLASLAATAASQVTSCRQLQSGFGYICSPDLRQVQYCQPDQSPQQVVSQYCGSNDCFANGAQGFCGNGVTSANRARGPTSCEQVDPNGGYICSSDYTAVFQCSGFNTAFVDYCPNGSCFASTTGDHAQCVR